MIELKITADNASDLLSQLTAVSAALAGTAISTTTAPSADPKPTRGRGKAQSAEGNATSATSADAGSAKGSTPSTDAASAGTAQTGEIDEAGLRKKCTEYGAKAGNPALKELFIEQGSAQGNFTGIPRENWPKLEARLDEMLAA